MILAICPEVVTVIVILVSVSEHRFLRAFTMCIVRYTLALCLRLSNTEFFRYEAVFDYLVNVLFLGEGTLVVEIHIAHLLADIRLVDILWVVPDEAVVGKALPNDIAIDTICMGSSRSLLVTARLDLIFAEENSFAMYLLKGNVCGRKIIIVDSILIQRIHRRVGT